MAEYLITADNVGGEYFRHKTASDVLLWLFADRVADEATDCFAYVWPQDQHDGDGHPFGVVHKSLVLQITQSLDNARYIGSMWGHKYPHRRADAGHYDTLDPAKYRAARGDFYRDCRAKFGRCVGKTPDGWIFGQTNRWHDPIYIETKVTVKGIGCPDLI